MVQQGKKVSDNDDAQNTCMDELRMPHHSEETICDRRGIPKETRDLVVIEDSDGSLIRRFRYVRVPSRGGTLQAVEHVGRRVRAGRKPCARRAFLSSMGQSRPDELS